MRDEGIGSAEVASRDRAALKLLFGAEALKSTSFRLLTFSFAVSRLIRITNDSSCTPPYSSLTELLT
jgi:hypothetical protein